MVLTSERRDTLPESPEGEKWSGGLEEKRLEAKMEQSTLLMVRNKSGDIIVFVLIIIFLPGANFFSRGKMKQFQRHLKPLAVLCVP